MRVVPTALPGVVRVEPALHADARGWFSERYHAAKLDAAMQALGLPPLPPFVQDNESCSAAGVLRGLHWQAPPHAQGKLVRVLRGAAFDVAVDLRRGSPHFGRWTGAVLSAANGHQLWVPPGFAHGFLALEDETLCLYKVSAHHHPPAERRLRWDDPDVGIAWPLAPGQMPRLSPADASAPGLAALGAADG